MTARRPTTVDRPEIPAEYGVPKGTEDLVDWSRIERRLDEARVYWIATSGPDGRPRVRPVDALYVDGVIYIGGSPQTRWAKDLAANPHVSVHLDGLDDVVIVEGEAELMMGADPELAERLAAASNAKFPEYGMTAESYKGPGPFAIRARKVVAWTNFAKDPTRFRFEED